MVYAGDLKSLVPERGVAGSTPAGATGCDGTRRAGCPVLPDKQNGQIRFLVVLLEYLIRFFIYRLFQVWEDIESTPKVC